MQRSWRWCTGLAVGKDAGDESWVGNGGDDPNGSPTTWTVSDVNLKHPAQALHPAHRCGGIGFSGVCFIVRAGMR